MSLQFDQLNNQLKTNDSTNANASMVLTPAGTGSVLLNGTGSNQLQYSQALATSPWVASNSTLTNNVVTAPDGTTTASKLTESATNSIHLVQQAFTETSGITYTLSVYVKNAGRDIIRLEFYNATDGNKDAYFTLSTATVSNLTSGVTGTITNAGNGWYRCTATYVTAYTGSATNVNIATSISAGSVTYLGDGTSGVYLWGAQLELGSTANTYVPTTTATIYNSPILSLSGVANIGLQLDGSMYVQPAGTGALQAQATTSSATGGNARGSNAVDLQTQRATAVQIASGANSFVGSGYANYSNNYCGVTVGGYSNGSSYLSSVGGGQGNFALAQWSAISGGNGNTVNGFGSFIGSGSTNTAAGFFNVIGGGQLNSGTANAAVTTQSATMNGTTAVTLSGSNASIKVGQAITGTSINNFPTTYVAAISGTSLTLSQVASGSSTSTLSFFTPHGVVVGGGNNTATGSYSFIGGGGDAGTAANANVASGDWSTVVGGRNNTASGAGSFIGGGGYYGGGYIANNASGLASGIVGGVGNNATGFISFIAGGSNNFATGSSSSIGGGASGSTRGITGYTTFPASNTPVSGLVGSSQTSVLILGTQTTDATATVLRSDAGAAGTTNQVILPNNSAYYFRGEIVSGVTGGGNTKGWYIEGVIKRGANAASTALVGTPTVTSNYADAGAATWAIAVTADTTNGGLAVTFTGQAATTIRTVAQIRTTEMTY
jgi:hypothetical protein